MAPQPLAGVVAAVAGAASSADAVAALRSRAAALGARALARPSAATTHVIFCRSRGGRGGEESDLRALHDRVALVSCLCVGRRAELHASRARN
jgi:hypothetical protein